MGLTQFDFKRTRHDPNVVRVSSFNRPRNTAQSISQISVEVLVEASSD